MGLLIPLPSLSASAPSNFCAAQELLGLWGQPWHTRPQTWAWCCRSGPVCLQRGILPLAGSPGAIAEHTSPQPHKYLTHTPPSSQIMDVLVSLGQRPPVTQRLRHCRSRVCRLMCTHALLISSNLSQKLSLSVEREKAFFWGHSNFPSVAPQQGLGGGFQAHWEPPSSPQLPAVSRKGHVPTPGVGGTAACSSPCPL